MVELGLNRTRNKSVDTGIEVKKRRGQENGNASARWRRSIATLTKKTLYFIAQICLRDEIKREVVKAAVQGKTTNSYSL